MAVRRLSSLALLIILALPLLCQSGCWGFVHDEQIDGVYRLVAVDDLSEMSIDYDIGGGNRIARIDGGVFTVGWDRDFVVAARHPKRPGETVTDKSVTEYFYIVRGRDGPYADPSASVRGPLSHAEFLAKQKRLNLPPFTREIAQLK